MSFRSSPLMLLGILTCTGSAGEECSAPTARRQHKITAAATAPFPTGPPWPTRAHLHVNQVVATRAGPQLWHAALGHDQRRARLCACAPIGRPCRSEAQSTGNAGQLRRAAALLHPCPVPLQGSATPNLPLACRYAAPSCAPAGILRSTSDSSLVPSVVTFTVVPKMASAYEISTSACARTAQGSAPSRAVARISSRRWQAGAGGSTQRGT